MANQHEARRIKEEIFDVPKEELLCVAGKRQLTRFLKNGKLKEGFVVLSDHAIYCKGDLNISRDHRHFERQKTEIRVQLEEFQTVKYLHQKGSFLLFLGFFFVILGPALLLLEQWTSISKYITLNLTLDAVLCELTAGLCFMLYSIHGIKMLELIHTNGSIGIDLRFIPEKEERLLIRYLRACLNNLENASKTNSLENELNLD